jgi:HD superfamily phosphohydrolase
MALYDTVYHHHKVRAANSALQELLTCYHKRSVWRTRSKRLCSITDFLELDEYDFFGAGYKNVALRKKLSALRYRALPKRALVIMARCLCDKESHNEWAAWGDASFKKHPRAQQATDSLIQKLRKRIVALAKEAGAKTIKLEDVLIDIPSSPKLGKLGTDTLVQLVPGKVTVPLKKLFPFHKVVNNYSNQYKYKTYVFATAKFAAYVSYAAFRTFAERGMRLNDLALILAHQNTGKAHELLIAKHVAIPDWNTESYVPDSGRNED